MQPARQLAQLRERLLELRADRAKQRARLRRIAVELAFGQADGERQADEPLLGAVVKVALQATALGVAGLDDARARSRELLARLGVGQRLGGQLGEARDPLLRPRRERLGLD